MIDKILYNRIVDAHEKICDSYCKYPYELLQKDLDEKCDTCPFIHLEEELKEEGLKREDDLK